MLGTAVSVVGIVVTTKRRAGGRPPLGPVGTRRAPAASSKGRARPGAAAPPAPARTPAAVRRRAEHGGRAWLASVVSVFESHAEDVWGIALVTAAVLGALALYGDALGPVGQGLRHGLGSLLGVGRFVVPPAVRRRRGHAHRRAPRHEPARAAVGLALALAVGRRAWPTSPAAPPACTASSAALAGRRGLHRCRGRRNPLRPGSATGGPRSSLLALVPGTGVVHRGDPARRPAGTARGGAPSCGSALVPDGDRRRGEADDDALDGRRRDRLAAAAGTSKPAGSPRAVRSRRARGPEALAADVAVPETEPTPTPEVETPGLVDARLGRALDGAEVVAADAERTARDRRGRRPGEWRLPPPKPCQRSKQQELDRAEITAAGPALVERSGRPRGGHPPGRDTPSGPPSPASSSSSAPA